MKKVLMKKKISITLTPMEMDDLISCVHFTLDKFPKEGATHFLKAVKRIKKKLWKILKEGE